MQKKDHIRLDWYVKTILFTISELFKLYRGLFHKWTTKVYNVLKRSPTEKSNGQCRKKMETNARDCFQCQKSIPNRFKVILPDDDNTVKFNGFIALDLLWSYVSRTKKRLCYTSLTLEHTFRTLYFQRVSRHDTCGMHALKPRTLFNQGIQEH